MTMDPSAPITEADLHGYVDGQLAPARPAQVEEYLAARADERERVLEWQRQNAQLRGLLDPVLAEPLPLRLPLRSHAARWPWRALAAGVAIATVSAASAWVARGALDAGVVRQALARSTGPAIGATTNPTAGAAIEPGSFAHRAAVAHAVYSPEQRRPVEVGADQVQALVTWLSKRLGTPVHAPSLGTLGYALVGGRLLPGGQGPVAQFMYAAPDGQRLTLYVTREVAGQDTAAFKFGRDGAVNVFYWVDERFGYAISGPADRDVLLKVSQEVYRQLKPG